MPTIVSESSTIERELWTAADFLDWLQPGTHADLIDGVIFMHSPVSFEHPRLTNQVKRLIAACLERPGFGGELYREVVAVKLDGQKVATSSHNPVDQLSWRRQKKTATAGSIRWSMS